MRNMLKDVVTITYSDGTKREEIRALVDSKTIFINDVTIPISIGDKITRTLPSGQEETFIVTNFHLQRGGRTIPDFYEISYRREELREHHPQPPAVSVHLEGSPQSRVNLNSPDQSINVINSEAEDTFNQVRDLLSESISDSATLELLLERVDVMERSQGTGGFTSAYREFVSAAADHMTVLAPVIPMLSAML